MTFAILRATNVCLRGSRKKWTGLDDGSGSYICVDACIFVNVIFLFFLSLISFYGL